VALALVLADQQGENGSEEHEDHGLDKTDKHFEEIKGNRQQPAKAGDKFAHSLEHVFASKDVSVESEAERDGPEQDRDEFETTGSEEYNNHQSLQKAAVLSFRAKQFFAKADDTDFADGPENPTAKEDESHGKCHIQVGIGTSQKWAPFGVAVSEPHVPADRTDPWNQTSPIREENEDENGGEEPEGPLNEIRADNAFQEIREAFDEPFPKVLYPGGDAPHVSRSELGKQNEANGDGPGDDHGVCNREAEWARDLDGMFGQAVGFRAGSRLRARERALGEGEQEGD